MKWSSVIWVWIVAVASLGCGWWLQRDSGVPEPAAGVFTLDLANLDPTTVDRITLDREGHHWVFERRDSGWWQTEPFEHRMRGELLRGLLDTARRVSVLDAADASDATVPNAATLGLDPPVARLTAGTAGGPSHTIELGRRGMAGHAWARQPGVSGENRKIVHSYIICFMHDKNGTNNF